MDIAACTVLISLLLCRLVWASVLVYEDAGTSLDLVVHLMHSLAAAGERQVRRIKADELARGDWMGGCKMLIIPAGRDVEYVKLLSREALQLIRQFVEGGGSYMGICGGAYFASGRVMFEPGRPLGVVGARELALFPGTAYGSAYQPFDYQLKDMRAAPVNVHQYKDGQRVAKIFHMGGCVFDQAEVARYGWEVIGTYTDLKQPAMIGKRIGRGKVTLICPHIEFDPELPSAYSAMDWHKEAKGHGNRRQNIFNFLVAGLQPDAVKEQPMDVEGQPGNAQGGA